MRVALLLVLLWTPVIRAGDATQEHAEAFWKNNVHKTTAKLASYASDNVLTLGTADMRALESLSKAAERSVVFAKKSVGYDEKPVERRNARMDERPYHWKGKLIVFVCKDRQEFVDLFTQMKSGRPGPGEVSAYYHTRDHSYVLIGPSGAGRKVQPALEVVQFVGIATLTRRHDPVPAWLAAGFGRMLAYKYDSKGYAAERRQLPIWAGKHHVRELMTAENNSIPAYALVPLQASLVECLSQSPTFQGEWHQLLDEMAYRGGNLEAAMNEKKLPLETLQLAWKDWLWK